MSRATVTQRVASIQVAPAAPTLPPLLQMHNNHNRHHVYLVVIANRSYVVAMLLVMVRVAVALISAAMLSPR